MNGNRIRFAKMCEVNGAIYFFAIEVNGLFRLNPDTGEAKLIASVPEEFSLEEALYKDIQYCDNKLYGIPYSASNIAIYDLDTKIMKTIKSEETFITSFIYGRNLYMVPFKDNSLWIFHMNTGEVTPVYQLTKYNDVILKKVLVLGHMAYFVCYNHNFIFRYDLISQEKEYIFINQNILGFRDLIYYDDQLWLLPVVGGYLTALDMKNNKIQTYEILNDDTLSCFSQMVLANDKLFLLPSRAEKIAIFDIASRKAELIDLKDDYKNISKLNFSYGFSFEGRNFGISNNKKSLVLLDENQTDTPIFFSNPEDLNIKPEDIAGHVIREQTFFTLDNYLSSIGNMKIKKPFSLAEKNIGLKIHQIID